MGKIHCPPFFNFTRHKQTLVTWSDSATNQRLPDSSNKLVDALVERLLERLVERLLEALVEQLLWRLD